MLRTEDVRAKRESRSVGQGDRAAGAWRIAQQQQQQCTTEQQSSPRQTKPTYLYYTAYRVPQEWRIIYLRRLRRHLGVCIYQFLTPMAAIILNAKRKRGTGTEAQGLTGASPPRRTTQMLGVKACSNQQPLVRANFQPLFCPRSPVLLLIEQLIMFLQI